MTFYAHVDKKLFTILKISPVVKNNEDIETVDIDQDVAHKVIDGDARALIGWAAVLEKGNIKIVQRAPLSQMALERIEAGDVQEVKFVPDADVVLKMHTKSKTGSIQLVRLFGRDHASFESTDILMSQSICRFYFTKKNDPSYLLFTLSVPLSALVIEKDGFDFEVPVDCSEVSLYTKAIASTYSLEVTND